MKDELFKELIASAQEAVAIKKGEAEASRRWNYRMLKRFAPKQS